jgi:SAM-dependent methyltransferase
VNPSTSSYFDTRFAYDPRRAAVWRQLTRYLQRYWRGAESILELGAGYCYFINGVTARRRVAVDLSDHVLTCAAEGVEAVHSDAQRFLADAADAEFDLVFASNFLEHFDWPELDDMLRQVLRVLRPGGRLMLIQPNFRLAPGRYFDDYTHRTVFTDVSICDWLEHHGLKIVELRPRFMPLTVKSPMGHAPFLVPLYLRLPFRPFAGQMFVVAERPDKLPAPLTLR